MLIQQKCYKNLNHLVYLHVSFSDDENLQKKREPDYTTKGNLDNIYIGEGLAGGVLTIYDPIGQSPLRVTERDG